MSRANADSTAFQRAIDNDSTVKLACECGHESSYAGFSDFNVARRSDYLDFDAPEGTWANALATSSFQGTCPECGGSAEVATLVRQPHDTIILELCASRDASDDRESYFSPAASLSEKRAKYTEILDKDPAIELSCGCGFSDQFLSFSDFEAFVESNRISFDIGGGFLPYALAGDDFTLKCPDCGGEGGSVTLLEQKGTLILSMNLSRAATCPSCNSYIDDDGFKEGPGAPELGWEYYECPECGVRTRQDAVRENG